MLGEKKRLPFLESLIDRSQNGDKLTDQDIIDQVNTIMFEVKSLYFSYYEVN